MVRGRRGSSGHKLQINNITDHKNNTLCDFLQTWVDPRKITLFFFNRFPEKSMIKVGLEIKKKIEVYK